MFASFQKKYFLSDKGVAGVKRGIFWTAITNLVTMAGMGFLFLTMACFVEHLTTGAALPAALPVVAGLVVFLVLLFASNWQQYYYTYCIFYEECGNQRIEIAERLRKLPLSFFGRRDLADLTETIMGDVQTMEHAYSHVLGELWGAVIASAIVFVGSLFFCWQLAVAAFWSVPVAFAVLYITRGPMTPVFDRVRAEKVKVTEAVQETLDCVREIRATNQEEHYLEGLAAVIDREEREVTRGELANGLLVNSAFAILRLGIATTLATGAAMVVSGQVDFMVMFAFLLMVSRIYAPFDQALMLVSELFAAESSAKRMCSIMEEPVAQGGEKFEPEGHDVVFDRVAFGYGAGEDGRAGEKVLTDVSFTAREGEVTALVGPSGSGKSTVTRLAARFWDATSGKVTVGGVDVANVDPEVLLRDYAVVFQDVLLFDRTIDKRFTMVPNELVDNRSPFHVSHDAAGCWVHMQQLGPEWAFSVNGFISVSDDGSTKIKGQLKQLEQKGWVLCFRRRERGRWTPGSFWCVMDDPRRAASRIRQMTDMGLELITSIDPKCLAQAPAAKPQVRTRCSKTACGKSHAK